MNKKTKIASFLILSSQLLLSILTIAFINKKDYSVRAFEFSNEYFQSENMDIFTNKTVPSTTGIKDYRNGILLSSNKNGAQVTLKDEMSGTFTIDMLPYSLSTYNGGTYEGTTYSNSYQDIQTISLSFKDLENADNCFKIVLNGGANGNNVTVNAHVEINDEKMGVHYYQDAKETGNTNGANQNNIYTYLYGTSFSNVAVHNGLYASSNVKSIQLEFDPYTMCVYGYSYGYMTDEISKVLIWDFTKTSIDGSIPHTTLPKFNQYQVTLSFDRLSTNKTGNVLLYAINQQKFSNTLIHNNVGPQCHVSLSEGKTNQKYRLPKPLVYDVLDGNIDFSGTIEVYDENHNQMVVYDENDVVLNNNQYRENCYFVATQKGTYTLYYQANDLNGVAGERKAFSIAIYDENEVTFRTSLPKENYRNVGTTFMLPSIQANCNGNTYNTTIFVQEPSFLIKKVTTDSIQLKEEGLYVVRYQTTIHNQEYFDEVKIYASKEISTLFSKNNSDEIAYQNALPLNQDLSGLVVQASLENASVRYEKNLDISLLDGETNLISLLALPKTWGSISHSTLTVKLIDAMDATNYIQVIATAGNKCDISYVRAGASNQKLVGLNKDGTIATSSSSGTEILHSFSGQSRYIDLKEQTFDVYFDYLNKKVYTSGHRFVSDLDDSEFYSTSWNGFKGNQFILQVSCSGLNEAQINYMIKNVVGYDVTHSHYVDCIAPKVIYDENDFSKGVVNKSYPLPEVRVQDNTASSLIKEEIKVLKNNVEIPIVDNAFVPTAIGQYVISYHYMDCFGNEKEFIQRIQIVESIEPLHIELEEEITAGFVGSEIQVPSYRINGGEGKKKVTIVAKGNTTGTIYTIDQMKFIPLIADEYVLTYQVEDRLGNYALATTNVSIIVSDAPIIAKPEYIPNVLIDGKEVTFAPVIAKDYNNEKNPDVLVEMYIKVEETEIKLDSLSFVPHVQMLNSTATLIYKATSSITNCSTILTYEIPVVRLYDDNEVLHLSQYLLTKNFDQIVSHDTYMDLTTTVNQASIEFIKKVYAHGFQLSFNIPANANNVQSIRIYLMDAQDASKQVSLDIIKGNKEDTFSYLSINNGDKIAMVGTFFGTTAARLKIAYDNTLYSLKDDSGVDIAYIKTYQNGDVFRGFTSEINFKVVLEGVTGITTFRLFEVGNQIMSSVDDDYTVPSITLNGELVRQAKINETILIPSAEAFDILGFKTTISIRITDPEANVVYTSNDGTGTMLKLEKYGTYYVSYNASDERGNPMTYSRTITVLDDIAPTIVLNGEITKNVTLNEKVSLPEMQVSDNITTPDKIATGIILEGPNGLYTYLSKNEFIPTVSGRYIIRYYAIDEAGNIVYKNYIVEVN